MTLKLYILIILSTLGFPSSSTLVYACGNLPLKIEISCCKKGKIDKDFSKECCKTYNSTSNQSDKDCNGKCNHSSCQCPTIQIAFLAQFIEISLKNPLAGTRKTNFYHFETNLSSGYLSIWTPPNIG